MITIDWGKADKSIMRYTFEGDWSMEDLIEALDAGMAVTNKYDHDIDVIVDLTQSGLPNFFMNIGKAFDRAMNRTDEHREENEGKEAGLVVIISTNPIIRNSLSSMLTIYKGLGETIALANTTEDALRKIEQFRAERDVAAIA
ncbi:MAG: hypothetical protein AAF787_08985 [Chloroflexota bacterium]